MPRLKTTKFPKKQVSALRLVTIAILGFALFGCQSGSEASARGGADPSTRRPSADKQNPLLHFSSDRANIRGPSTTNCSVYTDSGIQPWICLEQICQGAGGAWSETTKSCRCPEGLHFTGNSPPRFSCTVPAIEEGPQYYQADHSKSFLLQSKLSRDLITSIWGPNSSRVHAFYDQGIPANTVFVEPSSMEREEIKALLARQLQPTGLSAFDFFSPLVLVESPDEIASYYKPLQISESSVAFDWTPTEELGEAVQSAFRAYRERSSVIQSHAQVQTYTSLGCLDSCVMTSNFEVGVSDNRWRVQWRRSYSFGVAVRSQLLLSRLKTPARVDVLLQLDTNDGLNLIFERSLRVEGDQMVMRTQVLDRHGRLLTELSDLLISQASRVEAALSSQPERAVNAGTILVCEDGVNLATDIGVTRFLSHADQLRLGRHRSTDITGRGSLMGWFENRDASPETFLSGLEPHERQEGRDRETDMIDPDHTGTMLQLITFHHPELSVIPMRFTDCVSRYQELSRQFPDEAPPRIVNVSMGEDKMDEAACEHSDWKRAIESSRNRQLWILATPNEGVRSKSQLHCPTTLQGLENVLVVTPHSLDDPSRIEDNRAQGTDIVDLAVDGHTSAGASGSAAAARTSQLAAVIALAHPDLNPRDLKLALMTGVDETGVDVRAHGTLNPQKAMYAADLIAQAKHANEELSENALREAVQSR